GAPRREARRPARPPPPPPAASTLHPRAEGGGAPGRRARQRRARRSRHGAPARRRPERPAPAPDGAARVAGPPPRPQGGRGGRARRMADKEGWTVEQALARCAEEDGNRDRFTRYFFGDAPFQPAAYDLTFQTARVPLEDVAACAAALTRDEAADGPAAAPPG